VIAKTIDRASKLRGIAERGDAVVALDQRHQIKRGNQESQCFPPDLAPLSVARSSSILDAGTTIWLQKDVRILHREEGSHLLQGHDRLRSIAVLN
jgi:hypothetical protein